jgi:hypothetical protein
VAGTASSSAGVSRAASRTLIEGSRGSLDSR